jgi:hypothetical protein
LPSSSWITMTNTIHDIGVPCRIGKSSEAGGWRDPKFWAKC